MYRSFGLNRFLFFLFFLFLFSASFKMIIAQEVSVEKESCKSKNAIRFIVFGLPPGFSGYGYNFSLAYERKITKSGSIEVGGFYAHTISQMGDENYFISIKPGYRHYFKNSYENNSGLWAAAYFNYLLSTETWAKDEKWRREYWFGIGVYGGIRLNISKNRKWFFDLGIGLSYNKGIHVNDYFNDGYKSHLILPRTVVQFGVKF